MTAVGNSHPPLILRAVDGRLESFEPRAHPMPWMREVKPHERRRRARTGTRGRRGAKRCDASEWSYPDPLPDAWFAMKRHEVDGLDSGRGPSVMTAEKIVMQRRKYGADVTARCPYQARGASCGERCFRMGEHKWTVTAHVYAEDHLLYEQQIEALVAAEARKLRARIMREAR